jgi:hypothetical protein
MGNQDGTGNSYRNFRMRGRVCRCHTQTTPLLGSQIGRRGEGGKGGEDGSEAGVSPPHRMVD